MCPFSVRVEHLAGIRVHLEAYLDATPKGRAGDAFRGELNENLLD
jgi:hypothetical protein